mmetsp:Transcript_10659/g.31186  ORF Transcript_10659/g.31186 Transcript_10659/m.31186 type:complete len:236 (+) Transcript_10659:1172-1879(+)
MEGLEGLAAIARTRLARFESTRGGPPRPGATPMRRRGGSQVAAHRRGQNRAPCDQLARPSTRRRRSGNRRRPNGGPLRSPARGLARRPAEKSTTTLSCRRHLGRGGQLAAGRCLSGSRARPQRQPTSRRTRQARTRTTPGFLGMCCPQRTTSPRRCALADPSRSCSPRTTMSRRTTPSRRTFPCPSAPCQRSILHQPHCWGRGHRDRRRHRRRPQLQQSPTHTSIELEVNHHFHQ